MGFLDQIKTFFKGPNNAIPQTDPDQTLQTDLAQGVLENEAEHTHADPAGSGAADAATTATVEPLTTDASDEPATSDTANP